MFHRKSSATYFLWLVLILGNFCINSALQAQNPGRIEGRVINERTEKPLPHVNVVVMDTHRGAATRASGEFTITGMSPGTYTLRITAVGFESVEKPVTVSSGETVHPEITLFPQPLESQEIVVTGTRRAVYQENAPEVAFVMNDVHLRQMGAADVSDALSYLPGVHTEGGTGSGQPFKRTVSINGMPAIYSLVLVDGTRMLSSHVHTGVNVNMVPPENIERIEVLKGASSAQYGSDGMGGVVNIITKSGTQSPTLNVSAYRGTRNTSHADISYSGPVGEKVVNNAFINWEQSDGLPIQQPQFREGALDYSLLTFMDRLDATLTSNLSFSGSLHFVDAVTPYKQSDPYHSRLLVPKMGLEYSPADHWEIRPSAYYTRWKSERNDELNELLSPEVLVSYDGLPHQHVLAGAEYYHRNFTRSRVPEHQQRSWALFLQDEYSPHPFFSLLAAVRLDKAEKINPVISPKISIHYKPGIPFSLRLSAGRGFRAPTVQDLYETLYSHPGDIHFRAGNPDLEPEYSTGVTGNLVWHPHYRVSLMATGYFNKIDNLITPVDHGLEDPTKYFSPEEIPFITDSLVYVYRRENIHRALVTGGEFELNWEFSQGWRAATGFSLIHNRNQDTGESLPYYPGKSVFARLTGARNLSRDFHLHGFIGLCSIMDRMIWRFKHDQEQQVQLDDYNKLDAGITLTFKNNYHFFLTAENLLGEELHMYEDVELITTGESFVRGGIRISL
ncbi:MAG TPA: TonB-dependent receptor [bacterium]|nr:TonB-dependent receptor [bacterium]